MKAMISKMEVKWGFREVKWGILEVMELIEGLFSAQNEHSFENRVKCISN